MQDLTQGSIPRHVLTMAAPVAAGMLLQTLYYIVDLYFVAQLGDAPVAGVSASAPRNIAIALRRLQLSGEPRATSCPAAGPFAAVA